MPVVTAIAGQRLALPMMDRQTMNQAVLRSAAPHDFWLSQEDQGSRECHQHQMLNHVAGQ
jgi:hypothetical protein